MTHTPATLEERLRGGKCPQCQGWGEVAYFGEMVGCTCLGRYEAPISMATRVEAAAEIASLRAEVDRWIEAHRIAFEQAMANGEAASSLRARVEALTEALGAADDAWEGFKQTQLAASAVGVEIAQEAREGYGLHLTLALRQALKDTPNTFDISRQEARMAAVGLKDSDNA
jgi:hypothetical protein